MELHHTFSFGVNIDSCREVLVCATSGESVLAVLFWLVARLNLGASTTEVLPQANLAKVCDFALELLCLHDVLTCAIRDDEALLRIGHARFFLVGYESCHSTLQRVVFTCDRSTNHLIDDDVCLTASSQRTEVLPVVSVLPVHLCHSPTDVLIGLPDAGTNLKRDNQTAQSHFCVPYGMHG